MNTTDVDLDDDDLPGDEAPPEAELYEPPRRVPQDQGNANAELKETKDG